MENLGINYKLLIAQIINFGLLFLVFKRFVAKPFFKYLHEEQSKDNERERITVDLQTKQERMRQEEDTWRKKVRKEEEKILGDAKKSAEEIKTEILAGANKEAAVIVEKARKQVAEERELFYQGLKKSVGDISIFVIEKALKNFLTMDMQKKLTEQVLENIKKEKVLYEN